MSEPQQPDERPRPQYGEYAPPGWQSPVPPQPVAPAPGTPAANGGWNGQPNPANQPGTWPPAGAQPWQAPQKPRTADRVVTIILLAIGLWSVLQSLSLPELGREMVRVFEQRGLDYTPPPIAGSVGWLLLAINVVLFALVTWWSLSRLRANRLTWWVPLVGGVVSVIVQLVGVTVVLLSTPGIMDLLERLQ